MSIFFGIDVIGARFFIRLPILNTTYVVSHGKEFPLRMDLGPPSQGKPIQPESVPDVAEDGFSRVHALAFKYPSLGYLKALNYRIYSRIQLAHEQGQMG
ncbi:hypothetical protein DBB_5520 [Desulfoluna spongiiphila]|nr:hypothetical protein [Desulfoluna spongiiphila]VVS90984.1 hypothetical protein DBB_5520 [Desulfoluna spongiiphila]